MYVVLLYISTHVYILYIILEYENTHIMTYYTRMNAHRKRILSVFLFESLKFAAFYE